METGSGFLLETLCLLLYDSNDDETKVIVQTVIDTVSEDIDKGIIENNSITKLYLDIIRDIHVGELNLSDDIEVATLMLKFEHHPALRDNPNTTERIEKIISGNFKSAARKIFKLKKSVKRWLIWHKGERTLKKMFGASQKIIASTDPIVQDTLLCDQQELTKNLTDIYQSNYSMDNASIDFIDMSDIESIKKALQTHQKRQRKIGYKTGLQGINRMLGSAGGFIPGEFTAIGGDSGHYKSGLLMDFARWLATYNEPTNRHGKQDAIIFISLENEITENLYMWFESVYRHIYHKDPDGLSIDVVVDEVYKIFNEKGFRLLVYREDGDNFNFNDWRARHDEVSKSYNLIGSVTDYAGVMDFEDGSGDNKAKQYQNLLCRMKTYTARNNLMTFTGLQLNAEAIRMIKSPEINTVRKLGAGHLADCTGAKRELNILIFGVIEKNNMGISYYTMMLDKHKYVTMIQEDRYCAYAFKEGYGLPDDINGKDMSVSDIYADQNDNSIKQTYDNSGLF